MTPSNKLRAALVQEKPLQIVGTINAISALLAQKAGFRAIYLSGAGVANAAFGLPDLGITTLTDVLEEARRITSAVDLPLLVDIDTGFGSAFNIARTVREMIRAGVAAVHLEDQVSAKRCGHRPNKKIVPTDEMVDRIKMAVDAKTDASFIIMARTDALANEGLEAALERVQAYISAGADMIFFEGARHLEEYQALRQACAVPILANITEFGLTPLFSRDELSAVGVDLILYPLGALRVMNKSALDFYQTLRKEGSQQSSLEKMQTREELYELLHYHAYEKKLDELFVKGNSNE